MTDYPAQLVPDSLEVLLLPSGDEVHIPKARPAFRQWTGEFEKDTYGNKPLVDMDGEPLFAELAILRLFQKGGWDGVWVDTFGRKYRTAWEETGVVRLSGKRLETLKAIQRRAGSAHGCFDVYCWRDDLVLFAESKRASKDHIRDTQLRWLEAALRVGLEPVSFLTVEWSFANSLATDRSISPQAVWRDEYSRNPMTGGARIVKRSDRRMEDEEAPGPPSESLRIYFDAHDPDAHDKFLRWKERNWRGYVISRRSPADGMLHRADCGHFEYGDESVSLTRTMKVCSLNKAELESWARENMRQRLKLCRSCM